MNYIDDVSWKCLLGPRSKNIQNNNGIFTWSIEGKKRNNHFTTDRDLTIDDINKIQYPCNFHYLSQNNMLFVKQHFKINTQKKQSTSIDISNMNFSGRKYHGIRGAINKCKKINLSLENNYRDFKDVLAFINEWSDTCADKYFRDNSGKNVYFLKNNWHSNCINLFVYDKDKLIALSILSPNNLGNSSYVIGKSLCKSYPGLSEFTDVEVYKKALLSGTQIVNLGQSEKGLIFYKEKFPNSSSYIHYNGSINAKI